MGQPRRRDLVLGADDRAALERVVLDPDASPATALRSTAMLMAAESGMADEAVARRLGVSISAVWKWRNTLADDGVEKLTLPTTRADADSRALRYHPWVGTPSMRLAKILQVQKEVLQSSFVNLKQKMIGNLLRSSQNMRLRIAAAKHADQETAAATAAAAQHTPHAGRTAWGAAVAQRSASGAVPPVKQAAVIDAAVKRIVGPVGGHAGSVSPGDFSILHTLAWLGPMRTGELAKAERISHKAALRRLPILERRGFLTLSVDAAAKNSFVLTATERTRALVSGANPAGIERFVAGFDQLSARQRAELTAALRRLGGISTTPGPDTVDAYRAIATLSRMMDPADPSLLTARGADAVVKTAHSGPLCPAHIVGPESNNNSAYKLAGELQRLKYIEPITDPTSPHREMLTATATGRELATALTTAPETVAAAPFTAAVARLDPVDRSVLAQGLAELVKLIGR